MSSVALLDPPAADDDRVAALIRRLMDPRVPIASIGRIGPMAGIALVREGVPAALCERLAGALGLSRERLYAILGLPRATIDRKLRESRKLNQDESERVLGLTRLVAEIERIVAESGEPEGFDAGHWLGTWLETKNAALGGRTPGSLLDAADGRDIVATLIARMQSGAYS